MTSQTTQTANEAKIRQVVADQRRRFAPYVCGYRDALNERPASHPDAEYLEGHADGVAHLAGFVRA